MTKKATYHFEIGQDVRMNGHKTTVKITNRRDGGANDPLPDGRNDRFEYEIGGSWYSEGCLDPVSLK